jgi:hypothetical protein
MRVCITPDITDRRPRRRHSGIKTGNGLIQGSPIATQHPTAEDMAEAEQDPLSEIKGTVPSSRRRYMNGHHDVTSSPVKNPTP